MMKVKILSAFSTLMLIASVLITPVKADPFNGGIAIGIVGSLNTFDTVGQETEGHKSLSNPQTEGNFKDFTKDLESAAGFVEATMRMEGLGFGLTGGLTYIPGTFTLGSGTRTDTTTDASETNQDDSTYTAKGTASDHLTAYIEPTFYINNNFGIYGKIGISSINVKSLEDIESGTNSSTYGDKIVTGGVYGLGVRAISPWGIFMKLEYAETDYDEVVLDSSSGNKNRISGDISQKATTLSLGYQF